MEIDDITWNGLELLIASHATYQAPEDGNRERILISTMNGEGEILSTRILYSYYDAIGVLLNGWKSRIVWNGRGVGIAYTPGRWGDKFRFAASGCSDPEVSDGVDNDCDGLADEGFDSDNDGIDDSSDCSDLQNAEQVDIDGDGRGDACDCDNSSSTTWNLPSAVPVLGAIGTRETLLVWPDQGHDMEYDVLIGSLNTLSSTGSIPASGCLSFSPTPGSTLVASPPPVNDGEFYLVRAVNDCGISSFEHGVALDSSALPACP